MSIPAYSGPWTRTQAAHLLRRATFGPLKSEIDQAVQLGLSATLDRLFETLPQPDPPVYFTYDDHPAGIGDPWPGLPVNGFRDRNARVKSLRAWLFLTNAGVSMNVREKMVLFWNNHFGIAGGATRTTEIYYYFKRYRTLATGDFRELVKQMAVDPHMLHFLNGNRSTATQPNENFPRELLELYTIGKGPQVGPGDYTNYTETDVQELAKVYTGWKDGDNTEGYPSNPEVTGSYFVPDHHDTSTKQLSYRFGNAEITNGNELEYAQAIDLIFQQDEVARFICRKLYRYFVSNNLTEATEQTVIAPMAQILIDHDYVIAPALRALFQSAHFYQDGCIGNQIKSPVEFVHSLTRPMQWVEGFEPDDIPNRYQLSSFYYGHAEDAGMALLLPPSVAGWEAYYQAPNYDRLWISAFSLEKRTEFLSNCTIRNMRFPVMKYDWLPFLDEFDNPQNPNSLIAEFGLRFLTHPLHPEQVAFLKEELLPGLEDNVWSSEYANYLANPNDEATQDAIRNRLTKMVFAFVQLAEFYVQ